MHGESQRFNPVPNTGNADHFIAVVNDNGQWKVDNNTSLTNFTPIPGDLLVAQVDFTANTATALVGQSATVNGIESGYASGNLVFTPEQWGNNPNAGEFRLTGNQLTRNSANGASPDTDTLTYDKASRLVTADSQRYNNQVAYSYHDDSTIATENITGIGGGPNGYTVTRGYDPDNRLTSITHPDGSVTARTYTARHQLQSVTHDGNPHRHQHCLRPRHARATAHQPWRPAPRQHLRPSRQLSPPASPWAPSPTPTIAPA